MVLLGFGFLVGFGGVVLGFGFGVFFAGKLMKKKDDSNSKEH